MTYKLVILYVMNTKITLRMDERLIKQAKSEADRRGKSVSQMVGEFFAHLGESNRKAVNDLPPVTASLLGVLKGHSIDESAHKKHLREKYL